MTDLSRCRKSPYKHQIVGIEACTKWNDPDSGRIHGGCFALWDEMGNGKSKQTIDAAQLLFEAGAINRVIVVAPASVRSVWFDRELGELAKHLWLKMPVMVSEYHAKVKQWFWTEGPIPRDQRLAWIITNYDFIRNSTRLIELKKYCGPKTLLILDESSACKNYRAQQTKACMALRKKCGRVILLNGTPIDNNPGDLYSQGLLMDKRILDCDTWFHFRSRYAVLGGWMNKQVVGWRNLEDIQKRFAPYVLRRLKKDCLDLPPKLPTVIFDVPLTQATWDIYKEMRDQMVAWLSASTVSVSAQAVVKGMRLAQITSGFLGGLQQLEDMDDDWDEIIEDDTHSSQLPVHQTEVIFTPTDLDDQLPGMRSGPPKGPTTRLPPREIGREKLDFYLDWVKMMLEQDPELKLLTWCRFKPEVYRLEAELLKWGLVNVGGIYGGQKKGERQRALRLLNPDTVTPAPVDVVGTLGSGAKGLNLAGSHTVMEMSYDFRLGTWMQALDRVHRPGQKFPVSYFILRAVGPQGQRTIDHLIIKARDGKLDLATMTTSAWVKELMQEEENAA